MYLLLNKKGSVDDAISHEKKINQSSGQWLSFPWAPSAGWSFQEKGALGISTFLLSIDAKLGSGDLSSHTMIADDFADIPASSTNSVWHCGWRFCVCLSRSCRFCMKLCLLFIHSQQPPQGPSRPSGTLPVLMFVLCFEPAINWGYFQRQDFGTFIPALCTVLCCHCWPFFAETCVLTPWHQSAKQDSAGICKHTPKFTVYIFE